MLLRSKERSRLMEFLVQSKMSLSVQGERRNHTRHCGMRPTYVDWPRERSRERKGRPWNNPTIRQCRFDLWTRCYCHRRGCLRPSGLCSHRIGWCPCMWGAYPCFQPEGASCCSGSRSIGWFSRYVLRGICCCCSRGGFLLTEQDTLESQLSTTISRTIETQPKRAGCVEKSARWVFLFSSLLSKK